MKAAGKFAVAAVGAALVVAGALPATTAAAQGPQAYACQELVPGPDTRGFDCQALNGAPEHGPVRGPFLIIDANGGGAAECMMGHANLPQHIGARYCRPAN